MKPKLLLCDLDGTLAVKWEPELLGGRLAELKRLNVPIAIITNQGGIHARYAWEMRKRPDKAEPYPTLSSLTRRFTAVTRQLPLVERVYVAFYVGHDDYPLPEEREDVVQTLPTGALFHGSWAPNGANQTPACCTRPAATLASPRPTPSWSATAKTTATPPPPSTCPLSR